MSDDQISALVERMARSKGVQVSPGLIEEVVKRVLAVLSEDTAQSAMPSGKGLDPRTDYPLAQRRPDLVRTATGLSLEEINLDKAQTGQISFDDIKIRPETLDYQAQIAEAVGRPQLAANIRRAAEMTRISDERILEIYEALRPYRSTKKELLDIAGELEAQYQAKACAALVREAAEVYEKRRRLKRD
jgi:propanediol dehydratase small subunit